MELSQRSGERGTKARLSDYGGKIAGGFAASLPINRRIRKRGARPFKTADKTLSRRSERRPW